MGVHMRERHVSAAASFLMLPVVSFVGLCVTHLSLLMTECQHCICCHNPDSTGHVLDLLGGTACEPAIHSVSVSKQVLLPSTEHQMSTPVSIACGRDPPWQSWR
jgi:hypothetical protein